MHVTCITNPDVSLTLYKNSAVSEHANKTGYHPLWDEVKFIDWDLTGTLVELRRLST